MVLQYNMRGLGSIPVLLLLLLRESAGQNATPPILPPTNVTGNVTLAPSENATEAPTPVAMDATLVPTKAPTKAPSVLPPVVKLPCYDNTTILFDHVAAKGPFEVEEYILCPNTVFNIGAVSGSTNTCCIDGMSPLPARANTVIKCGESGASSNNCIINRGLFQMVSAYFTFFEFANNVEIMGLTFQDTELVSILLENDGDITFTDCIIKVRLFVSTSGGSIRAYLYQEISLET